MAQKKKPLPPPLSETLPADWMPDAFPEAQKTDLMQNTNNYFAKNQNGAEGVYSKSKNVAVVSNFPQTYQNFVTAHELGHSVFYADLLNKAMQNPESDENQKIIQWFKLHAQLAAAKKIPTFMKQYRADPPHSFAEAYAYYVNEPEALKKMSPEVYQYFVNLSGFEYSRLLGKPKK